MPSQIQIVPKYQHPHVLTYVYDNTEYTEDNRTSVDDSVKFIAVFRSSKGIDGKLVKKTSLKSFTDTFGKSNPKLYGQPLMMPIAELNTGVASVWAMRIMPKDAAYANSVLSAYYKSDLESQTFQVKFKSKIFSGADEVLNKNDLDVFAHQKEADEDGWTRVPLLTFRSMGRGSYGQNYRWRIVPNTDYERDYAKKIFTFEILSTDQGLTREAQYAGMMICPLNLSESLQINDVVANQEEGSYPVDIYAYEEGVEEIYKAYVDFLHSLAELDPTLTVEVPEIDEFDIFFGNELAVSSKSVPYEYYSVIGSAEDDTCCDISNPAGNPFGGGTEGSFDGDPTEVEKTIEQAYVDAFSGKTDKTILSPRRIPCDALLDANYPYRVKQALATLTLARNDCMCYMDCGMNISLSDPNFITLKNQFSGLFATREISKNIQSYEVRDFHTKKRTPVTITYFFAENLPLHYKNVGKHIPFVKGFASLSGHVKNSLTPSVEMWESDLKEELYLDRFNFFEAIGENQFERAVQNTAQTINSDLLEEHNMQTLFDIKRILEYDAWANTYNFTSQDERARFQQIEEAKFADWKGSKIDTIAIRFDVTPFEAERSILHCYCEVQFRNITKRTIIEIDVNKRNFLA